SPTSGPRSKTRCGRGSTSPTSGSGRPSGACTAASSAPSSRRRRWSRSPRSSIRRGWSRSRPTPSCGTERGGCGAGTHTVRRDGPAGTGAVTPYDALEPDPPPMRHPILWTLTGLATLAAGALFARRVLSDRHTDRIEAELTAPAPSHTFSEADLAGLPEPAQRYLRHAIAPGAPLSPSVRLWMDGTMTPTPGGPSTDLTAVETLAPHRGFAWTAEARMNGLPVRVRDHYSDGEGGVDVVALGLLPIPLGSGPDVVRSARGRLVAEAVWCPTALVHPSVAWESLGDDRVRFTLTVDADAIPVTLRL